MLGEAEDVLSFLAKKDLLTHAENLFPWGSAGHYFESWCLFSVYRVERLLFHNPIKARGLCYSITIILKGNFLLLLESIKQWIVGNCVNNFSVSVLFFSLSLRMKRLSSPIH